MKIVHFTSDGLTELNSSNWRGKIPAAALNRAGHKVTLPSIYHWFNDTDFCRQLCLEADLIIVERVLVEESLDRVRYWRERKKPIVCDIDDSYSLLRDEKESGNQASRFWYEGEVEVHHPTADSYFKKLERHPLDQFRAGARMCTGLTMPSRILAEDWRGEAKCWYVPNFIDSGRYLPFRKEKRAGDDLVIGWGGSMSHLPSFRKSGILEALRRVFQKRRRVKFLLAGDQRILPLLPIPAHRKIYQPYVMWQDWPSVLSRCDIGVAPLHGRYDHSRSFIKTSEYTVMGIPFIATGCPAYQDWMDAGVGVFVNDGEESEIGKRADEWEAALLDMIDNYDGHKAEIDGAFEFGMSFDVDRNAGALADTYSEIVRFG